MQTTGKHTFYAEDCPLLLFCSDLPSTQIDLIKLAGCLVVAATLLVVVVDVDARSEVDGVGAEAVVMAVVVERAAVELVVLTLLNRSRIWHKW